MKLQVFNKANCQLVKTGKPTISISQGVGVLTLSKYASDMMGFKALDEVAVAYDSDNNEWYIYKVQKDGFKLRHSSGKFGKSLMFNNKKLVDTISKHLEDKFYGRNGRMLIGSERIIGDNGEEYWPIITASFKPFKNS